MTGRTAADVALARIERGLGGEPIRHRPYTAEEAAALIAAAEAVVERNRGTEFEEVVGDWFADRLAEIDATRRPAPASAEHGDVVKWIAEHAPTGGFAHDWAHRDDYRDQLEVRVAGRLRIALVVDDGAVTLYEFTAEGLCATDTRWAGDMSRQGGRIVAAFNAAREALEDE